MKNQRLIEVKNIYNETNKRITSNAEEWKSFLEYYSKNSEYEFTFYQALLDSVEYCLLSRLGVNDTDLDRLENISELNDMQLTIALGTLTTKISNELLNEINAEIDLINKRGINHEREQQHNLQRRERWIALSRDNRFRGRYRFREVWNNSTELLRREGHNKIQYPSDDRGASSNIEETKSRRREQNGDNNGRTSSRIIEDRKSRGHNGGLEEESSSKGYSRGDSAKEDSLQNSIDNNNIDEFVQIDLLDNTNRSISLSKNKLINFKDNSNDENIGLKAKFKNNIAAIVYTKLYVYLDLEKEIY